MRSFLATCGRAILTLVLSFQIIVGERPWFLGGTLGPRSARAAVAPGDPEPLPSGATPAEATKREAAGGIDYGVDLNSGAFTTTIPIETPPGRMGVEPRLALTYASSSTTPSIVGAGWNLALSEVRVATDTVYQAAARYQLDGKRLIEDAAAPGTYATEHDTYARIRKTCAGSDCTFVVDDRSGLRMRFGSTAESRLAGRWGLDRLEDAHGNYMTVSYMTDAELIGRFGSGRDGALLPREIRYTGSATRAPWYAVQLDYELRASTDTFPFQSSYAVERLRYRVKTIRVVGGDGATIRTYALTYATSSSGHGLLSEVSVTGLGGATGPRPYTITYAASPTGFVPAVSAPASPEDTRVVLGDFDGDGRSDLLTYRRTGDTGARVDRWSVQLGGATGLGAAAIWLQFHPYNYPGTCADAKDAVFAGDWDGDGDTDLFHYASGCGSGPRWRVLVAQPGRFDLQDWVPAAETGDGTALDADDAGLVFADFTADGRADALVYRTAGATLVESRPAAPGYATTPTTLPFEGGVVTAGDVNGDRLTDLVMRTATGLSTACAIGGGNFSPCGGVALPANTGVTAGDFNGDGLTDLFLGGPTSSTLYTSARVGFVAQPVPMAGFGMTAADVDGDGHDDLLKPIESASGGTWSVTTWLQRGTTFVPGSTAGFPDVTMGTVPTCLYNLELLAADVTGDGRADPLLRVRSAAGPSCSSWQFATTAVDAPAVERLSSIQTPTGLTLQPWYQRVTQPGLPIALPVVKEIWLRDYPRVLSNRILSPILETHRYQFDTGRWDAARGELMGFGRAQDDVVERNLTEIVVYNQDLPRRGKPAMRVRARTTPYEVLSAQFDYYQLDDTAPYQTELAWQAHQHWESGAITAHTVVGYRYDASGNLTRVDDHGLCSRADDDRHTLASYRAASDFNVQRVAEVDVFSGAEAPPLQLAFTGCTGSPGTLVEATRNEYDLSASSVTRGDLTRTSRLVIDTSGGQSWLRSHDYTYRADGLVSSMTDARGYTSTVVSYDPVLDIYAERVRNPLGHDEVRAYEPHFGKLSRVTDPNGNAVDLRYDGFGRRTSMHTPLSDPLWMHSVTWAYGDTFPNWIAAIKPTQGSDGAMQGGATVEFRDALGRRIATVADGDSASERVISNRLTYWTATDRPLAIAPPAEVAVPTCGPTLTCLASWAAFQPDQIAYASLTAAGGFPAQFTLDPLGRTIRRDNPDGSFVTYTHSVTDLGFGTTQIDEVGEQRRIYRDARGELQRDERWPAAGGAPAITSYAHDARGKLTSVTSPLGLVTSLSWGSLGRLDRVSSPELGTLTFGYDADGHETSRTDARGVLTLTQVDELGRSITRTSSTGEFTMWAYDRTPMCLFGCGSAPPAADNTMGRPWGVVDATGFTTFAYDRDGHVARETRTIEGRELTTRYVTWPTGQVVSKTYPDGEVQRFALAPSGQQVALFSGSDPTPTVELTRDAHGRPAKVSYASGVVTQHHVDPVTQRIDAIDTFDPNGTVVQHVAYAFRPDGVVESVERHDTLAGVEQLYLEHDAAKRVTDVFVAPEVKKPAEVYRYDDDGRMVVRKDRGGDPVTVEHADPRHPNAVTSSGARSYVYDLAGNRVEDRDGSVTRPLGYDGNGRLATVGTDQTFVYDADGRRVIERGAGGTRIVAGGYSVETDGSTRKLLQLGTTRLGERSSVTGDRFFHRDALGSVIGESDQKGGFDTSRTFSAFGVTVGERSGGDSSAYGFAGYRLDAGTGLYFAQARYYDPATAGFTQPDSWLAGFDNPEALNAYAYAANSPYQYTDPSGHIIVPLIVGAIVSFAVGMTVDIIRAGGHPDWGYIIAKNLVLAGIGVGATYGGTLLAYDIAKPTWTLLGLVSRELMAAYLGGMLGGSATSLAAQAFHNYETGETGGYTRAFTIGASFGALANAFSYGYVLTGNPGTYAIVAPLAVTSGARILAAANPDTKPAGAFRFDAPSKPSAPPPSCGRGDDARTLPTPCEVIAP